MSKKRTLSTKVVKHPFVQNWIMSALEDHIKHSERKMFRRQFAGKLETYIRDVIRIATELDPSFTAKFFSAYRRKKVEEIGRTYPRAIHKRHVLTHTLALMARDALLLAQIMMDDMFLNTEETMDILRPYKVVPGFSTWHKNLIH
jgi:hypothetical protein